MVSDESKQPYLSTAESGRITRRRLLLRGAAAGVGAVGFWISGRGAWADPATQPTSPGEKLNIGVIGVGGRAKASLNEEDGAVASQNIVALCDVDEREMKAAAAQFPRAQQYRDYRKLLERTDLDAVVISTADHNHAPATLMALESGKHVYCEKPLTHTVEEARRVAEAARKHKRVTQLGTQIHAGDNYRRVVELIRAGAIGPVSHAHIWVASQWSGKELPKNPPLPPSYLDYDLWLGPVPPRPYQPAYHPQGWRSYWAFGNGTLGDMGCHYFDLPFWALDLDAPTKVTAHGPQVHAEACPPWLAAEYEFPARENRPAVRVTWHDGGRKPDPYDEWDLPRKPQSGVMFVGEKGMLFADYSNRRLLPEKRFADYQPPAPTIPNSIGHHREWLAAIRKNDPSAASCRFEYGGPLTEAVLLGAVAYRAGGPIEWNAPQLRAAGPGDADALLRGEYRKGWGM